MHGRLNHFAPGKIGINPDFSAEAATPLEPSAFATLLRAHPDSDLHCAIVSMLTHGPIIDYCGPHFSGSTLTLPLLDSMLTSSVSRF